MTNSFSLLRLPNEERLQVLRCMDRRILLLLSLLSRNTKDLVRSLQPKPIPFTIGTISLDIPRFQVWFNGGTCLYIGTWDITISFYKDPQSNMERLEKPKKVWIIMKEGTGFNTRWTEVEFLNHLEIREWYEHILYIIKPRQETEMIFTGGCLRFDLGAIKKVFGRIDSLGFNFSEPRDFVSKGLNTFLPGLKKLRLVRNPYPHEGNRLQKLLVQNFDSLDICDFERLNLEDLLICNAHHIKFSLNQQFDNINPFLKLWINGSNRRLQKLIIEQRTHFNPEEILKGIKIIREIPREEEIVYGENFDFRFAYRTRAVDIKRYDGTQRTVPFSFLFVMANSFSLLRLPNEEQLHLLRCMDRRSLLLLSLLSRNTKDLVRSLKPKPIRHSLVFGHMRISLDTSRFLVFFDDITRLIIRSWDVQIAFYREPQANMNELEKPNKVWVEVKEGTDLNPRYTEIEFPNFLEIKEWYEHILYIINETRQETEIKFSRRCEQFDLGAIKTTFGRIGVLSFLIGEPRDHVRKVLKTFLPDLKELRIIWNPYRHGDTRLQKLLVHNFDNLQLGSSSLFEGLGLEDLLICNAHHITFSLNEQFDDINQFFKLWIKGANSRLEKLTIQQRIPFNPEEILKGIKITREIPNEENIVYGEDDVWQYEHRTRAVDIERYDGTRGTIVMYYSTRFVFLVWN